MKILTFTGKTPSEALKKAKLEIGDDGILIETKEIQKRALGKEALYEIVIGIDEKDIKSSYKSLSKERPTKQENQDVLFDLSSAAEDIVKVSQVTTEDPLAPYMNTPRKPHKTTRSSVVT